MSLPAAIIAVLAHFEPCFCQPTWRKAVLLVVGTLVARGRRTVTTALRLTGHTLDPNFSRFHHVLNRARWVPLAVSHRLLLLLVATFVPPGAPVEIVVDETLERRWGPKISKRSHYRDPLLSIKGRSISNSGLRWVIFSLVVHVPWTERYWALPFVAVCVTPRNWTPSATTAIAACRTSLRSCYAGFALGCRSARSKYWAMAPTAALNSACWRRTSNSP
jgi:hypothetical protein